LLNNTQTLILESSLTTGYFNTSSYSTEVEIYKKQSEQIFIC